MLLFDPESWRKWHRVWAVFCLAVAAFAAGWFAIDGALRGAVPGGSSWPGLVCGVAAGVLFLYLGSYALRKVVPFRWWFRLQPTKFWLAQHVWFGLLTLPLVVLHMGLWPRLALLPLALLAVYLIVFASGAYGLWQQQRLPRALLQQVPDETIASQVPALSERMRQEAELLVLATCGPEENGLPTALREHIGRVRDARAGQNTGLLKLLPPAPLPETEPIRKYFQGVIDPYLRSRPALRSQMRLRARWQSDFADLRQRVNPAAHPVVDALQELCERRGEYDEQVALHARLHGWIAFHLVATAVLVLLLFWHAYSAVLYW